MPEFLGIAALELVVTDYKFIRGLRDAERAIDKFGGIWTKVGVGAGAALLAIGGASTNMAMKLETTFTLIQNLTENTKQDIDKFRDAIFDMSKALGKSPQELAEGLYAISSAGLIGARGLDVLEIAAKASAIGLGEVKTIGRLVTAAMVAYGEENLSAARATEIMAQAINFGALETDSLAGVMGRVLGPASKLGIAFEDVASFIATYSRLGGTASEATVSMTAIMQTLIKPSKEAADTLADLGISMADIRRIIREEGLAQGLQFLVEQFNGNDEALAKVIPNIRALRGVLGVTGEQMEEFIKIQAEIRKDTDLVNESFTVLQDTTQYKLTKAFNDIKTVMTQFGSAGLPVVSKMAESVSFLAINADKAVPALESFAQAAALVLGVLAIAKTVALIKFAENLIYVELSAMRAVGALKYLAAVPAPVWIAVAVAGFVALDVALKKFTGGGIIAHITGSLKEQEREAKYAAKAIAEYQSALGKMGENADKVTAATVVLNDIQARWNEQARIGAKSTAEYGAEHRRLNWISRDVKIAIQEMAKVMVDEGASLVQLELQSAKLEGRLKEVFDAEVKLGEARKKYIPDLDDYKMGVADSTDKQLAHNNAVKDTKAALETSQFAVSAYTGVLKSSAKAVEDFGDALDRLNDKFSKSNPEVNALRLESQLLDEQIKNIKNSTEKLTPAQEATIKKLEEKKKAIDGVIEGFDEGQESIEHYTRVLQDLMGEDGVAGFRMKMDELGVGLKDHRWVMEQVKGAYDVLATGSVPDALAAFEELKNKIRPEIWREIAAAIGPDLIAGIQSGISDGTNLAALLFRARALGIDISEGIAAGMRSRAGALGQTAEQLIDQALTAARARSESTSPSKLFAREVGEPIAEGVALGLRNGWNLVIDEAGDAIWILFNEVDGELARFRPDIEDSAAENIGEPIVDGIIEGIDDAAPALLDAGVGLISDLIGLMQQEVEKGLPAAMHGFVVALEEAGLRAEWEAAFGELGADLMMALTDALANPSESSGAAVYKALEKMLKAADKLNIPEAEALGKQIAEALAAGLASGSPELIAAALDLIGQLGEAIEEASQESAIDAAATFMASFTATMNSNALRDAVGSAGANLIEALRKGIEEGDEKALGTAGGVAANIVDAIRKEFDPKKAENFVALFMAALEDAINTGSAEAMARLQDVLAQIKEAGEKPKKEDTPTARREAYKGPRGVLVAEAQVGGRLSATDISYIAAIFGVSTDELLNMTRDEVRAAYQSISNPRKLFPSYVTDILGSYKSGIDFVPRDGWAFLHKNERVVPANENTTAGHVFNATIMIGTDVTDPRGTARWLDKYLRAWVDQQFNVERRRYVGRL